MTLTLDKRWREREERWAAPGELFRPAGYAVDVIPEAVAKSFVCRHHYSGSYPAGRLAVGLFGPYEGRTRTLVGTAVFSVPVQQRVIPAYTGLAPNDGVELGRFVCDPTVKYNGETWFLSRAKRLLAAEKPVAAIVSYADPLERRTAAGELQKRQHWGTIYQASSARFAGRGEARILIVAPDGTVVSRRALSKIRREESGWQYAARQLLGYGAPERRPLEPLDAWVQRALAAPCFRRLRHPGNLVYVFGLTAAARARIAARLGDQPYPKREAA